MTVYADLSQRTSAYAEGNHLAHAAPVIIAGKFGVKKKLPKNKADTITFRRVVPVEAATTPLTEGVAPSAQNFTYEDVTVELKQYGAFFNLTDKIVDMAEDPVLQDMTDQTGEQHGLTVEQVTLGEMHGGTAVARANGTARSAINTIVTKKLLRGATMFLRKNKAKPVTKYVPSVNKAVAEPVKPAYVAICHTFHQPDLEEIEGWTPIEKYGDAMGELPYEIGKIGEIRFCAHPDMVVYEDAGGDKGTMRSTTGVKADVYPIIIFGSDAFGTVGLEGSKDMELHIVDPKKSGPGNPLGQKGTVGWKSWFAAAILNQTWIIRLETAVTEI